MFREVGRCNSREESIWRSNFIGGYIICRFGIPESIFSDNGTLFAKKICLRIFKYLVGQLSEICLLIPKKMPG